jgi:hypothetical protein
MYCLSLGPVVLFAVFEQAAALLGLETSARHSGGDNATCVAERAAIAAEAAYYVLFLCVVDFHTQARAECDTECAAAARRGAPAARRAPAVGWAALSRCLVAANLVVYMYQRCNLAVKPSCDARGAPSVGPQCAGVGVAVARQLLLAAWLLVAALPARGARRAAALLYGVYGAVSVGVLLVGERYGGDADSMVTATVLVDAANLAGLNLLLYYHFSRSQPLRMVCTSHADRDAVYLLGAAELKKL